MRFTVDYPIVTPGYDPALVTAAGMTRVAQAVEECGYDAISFSEHPAPSQKVLRGVWTQVPYAHQGKHFTARGVASLPGPVQPGGPPVLIGATAPAPASAPPATRAGAR